MTLALQVRRETRTRQVRRQVFRATLSLAGPTRVRPGRRQVRRDCGALQGLQGLTGPIWRPAG